MKSDTNYIKIVLNLSCWLHSIPDTEVTQYPGEKQTKGQVPANVANFLNSTGQAQDSPPVTKFIKEQSNRKLQSLNDAFVHDTYSQNSTTEDVPFPCRSRADVSLWPIQPSYMKE